MGKFNKPATRRGKAIAARSLRIEQLDARLVLAADAFGMSASPAMAATLGESTVLDVVHDRTTYRGMDVSGYTDSVDVAAPQFLSDYASTLGLPADIADQISVIDTRYGLASSHAYLQQVYAGAPIHDAQLTVSIDDSGSVQTLHTSYVDHQGMLTKPIEINSLKAIELAEAAAEVSETWMDGETRFVWYVTDEGQLEPAWETMVHAITPHLEDLSTVVSALDGRILVQEDHSAHATGTGNVFEPNPYQTQGSNVGMVDNNDATSAALDAQMVSVTLERLDDTSDLLVGEWVDTTLSGGLSGPTASEPSRVYEYDRDDFRFEQVVVYHSVDQIQEYFHTLGFDDDSGPTQNGIRDFPTLASAHWFSSDQSFYSTGDDAIHFGDGGVDDGEDADIIAHEYGHAIQHNQNPNWGGGEMGAMGEGFGDYLAASFYADYGDATFQASHAAAVGEWDAVSYSSDNPPNLRRVDGDKSYPGDLVGQVHADGEIWSAALWDIRQELGGPTTDQLVLESHFGLPGGASMVDGANAILTADANINGGANQSVIQQWFVARGILTAPDDHGNIASEATVVSVPSTTAGLIDYADDADYFRFPAVAGTTYQIQVDVGATANSNVTLYDTNGATQLGFNDDGGTGDGSLLHWTAPATGDFYVNVGGSAIGSYSLDISTIATPADDHGDLTSAATAVAMPSSTAAQLEVTGDSDAFSFPVVAGEVYRFQVINGTLENSALRIIDSNGSTELASDTNGGPSDIVLSASTTGTLYAVVTGDSQGSYDLDVEVLVDDHGNDAASATAVAVPSTTSGFLEFDGDADFFSFTAIAGDQYTLETTLVSLDDSIMFLYGTDGTTELAFDDDDGVGLASQIVWTAPLAGQYYVAVRGYNDENSGTYELDVTSITPDPDDHGDTFASATAVGLNSTTAGNIGITGDVDYFSFSVPAGANVVAETTLNSITDTTLTLYDSDGITQLEFDDDDGTGLASLIDYTFGTAGTYFVAVRGYSNLRTGTYSLSISSDATSIDGDFNDDGVFDCTDIDMLIADIAAQSHTPAFDLSGDGAVDLIDRGLWLAEAGNVNLGPGLSYLLGDANLDGYVDVSDYTVFNTNRFESVAAWCSGDFNADGGVDAQDIILWNANKFTSSFPLAGLGLAMNDVTPAVGVGLEQAATVEFDSSSKVQFELPAQSWLDESSQEDDRKVTHRDLADRVFEQFDSEELNDSW